ncbi:uncharacterized protein MKK02DRAFT_37776 [Dioszegia hungarica]|uniref:Single-stranded DNA-binding protein n=1 Tax=Dioszegia hungarica TaxID=4972 RepID=A0AA38H665_9TREE|nr:uncharacterized protein MKK02DRAFT_37776 [Dioszegia hungarica]KAI9634900.1 hypothetical protein MKK02DRAFT_37776 [Dioszegia hungarica]
MFRQSIAKVGSTFKSATAVPSRGFAKVTLVGRLGGEPTRKDIAGAEQREYYLYRVAVAKPPKKDATGQLLRGEDGNPIRDTDWFSVFNFRENAGAVMPNIHSGDLVLVEATLQNKTDSEGRTENVLSQNSIKVLDRSNKVAPAA